MRRMGMIVVLAMGAGCGRPAPDSSLPQSDNQLELAARERGLVSAARSDPSGSFERRHELGRDAMCISPAGLDGSYRFVLEASFGPGLRCQALGRLRVVNDVTSEGEAQWALSLQRPEGCQIMVREGDDVVQFPGTLDDACRDVCPGLATLAGLSFPRTGWDAASANALRFSADGRGKAAPSCAD